MKLTGAWEPTSVKASSVVRDGLISCLQTLRETLGLPKKTCCFQRSRNLLVISGLRQLKRYQEGLKIKSKIDSILCSRRSEKRRLSNLMLRLTFKKLCKTQKIMIRTRVSLKKNGLMNLSRGRKKKLKEVAMKLKMNQKKPRIYPTTTQPRIKLVKRCKMILEVNTLHCKVSMYRKELLMFSLKILTLTTFKYL